MPQSKNEYALVSDSLFNFVRDCSEYDSKGRRAALDHFLTTAERLDWDIAEGLLELEMAVELGVTNDLNETSRAYVRAAHFFEEISRTSPSLSKVSGALWLSCGNLLTRTGEYSEASECLSKAAEIGRAIDDPSIQVSSYNSLANLHSSMGSYDLAEKNYRRGLELASSHRDIALQELLFLGLAQHYELSNPDSAYHYVTRALNANTLSGDLSNYAQARTLESRLHLIMGDDRAGITKGKEALQASMRINDDLMSSVVCFLLTQAYLNIGELDSAEVYIDESHRLAIGTGNPESKYRIGLLQLELAKRREDTNTLLSLYPELMALNDSIARSRETGRIEYMLTEREIKELIYQNDTLIEESHSASEEIKRRNTLILLISVLLVSISYLLWRVYRRGVELESAKNLLVAKNEMLRENGQGIQFTLDRIENELRSASTAAEGNSTTQTSAEDVEIRSSLLDRLFIALHKEKMYTDAALSLDGMAAYLGTNRAYLSKAINSVYKKSFSTLINELRIQLALQEFTEDSLERFTIESISDKVGFKSKSSFNVAFKRYTGVTPSHYKRVMLEAK